MKEQCDWGKMNTNRLRKYKIIENGSHAGQSSPTKCINVNNNAGGPARSAAWSRAGPAQSTSGVEDSNEPETRPHSKPAMKIHFCCLFPPLPPANVVRRSLSCHIRPTRPRRYWTKKKCNLFL
ncbi:hypothetical protein EVAR_65533_1 [Eumeta japonica]|uniref:Uncharacterized protein n=1 Tax=Eumeta variegata TaxID=151549 RepID=A0A4C1ZYA4_EUMVA|nr:hypothetical protein EVAR_65533_1 [Eumeta japonica]